MRTGMYNMHGRVFTAAGMTVRSTMFHILPVLVASALAASAAAAQPAGWPDRPVRLIVPFPAGSSADVVGRILAQKLSVRLGQQIVAENRVGASGNIGVDALAKATPDGYTIGIVTSSTHAVAPSLSPSLPYDPLKDFKPISMIGASPYVLVVYPGLPAKSGGTHRARQGQARHAQLRLGRPGEPRASRQRPVRESLRASA